MIHATNCKYLIDLDLLVLERCNGHMKLGRACVFLLLGSAIVAADTVTSVTCATFGTPLVSNASSCYAAGSNAYSQATSSGSVTVASTVLVSEETEASGLQGGIRGIGATSNASASADIQVNLASAGSVRQGLLEVTLTQLAWQIPYSGSLSEELTIGSNTYTLSGTSLPEFSVPVELGTAFGLDLMESLSLQASVFSGFSSAAIGSDVSVAAFEADGSTPVALFDPPGIVATPEPGSGWVLLAMLAAVVAVKLRSRAQDLSS